MRCVGSAWSQFARSVIQVRQKSLMSVSTSLMTILACTHLQAAELRLNIEGSYRSLVIEGSIEPGDYDRFLRIVKDSQGQINSVWLYSQGGDFVEAMKIGRALRALEISSHVPQRGRDGRPVCEEVLGSRPRDPINCTAASAAFFIHIGGIHRGGTYLAVHRPYFDPKLFGSLTQDQAKVAMERLLAEARAYMTEMAIPPHLQDEVLSTPSDKIVVLDERQIRTHIWGDLPHRHEWRRARCGRMSPLDSQRLGSLESRLMARERLTSDEHQEISRLQSARGEEWNCEAKLVVDSRRVAYERFFGTVPSDITGHNFSKWLDAPKYLGRSFEDVASEERFEPDRPLLGTSSLVRKETATSPAATVMDMGNKRKLVSWVSIAKEEPSTQFRENVIATLKAAWGSPNGDETNMEWTTAQFRARLTYVTRAARPGLVLVVEALSPLR